MLVEHGRKPRVRGDDRGAKGANRTLLLEQRRGVQTAPLPRGVDAGADLEVDVPVRITRTAGLVRDRDGLQLLHRHNLSRVPRPDPGDRVLGEPASDLRRRILLRDVEHVGDLRVQGGGDGEGLRGVDHHLREPGRTPHALARAARGSHRCAADRVRPVHPRGVLRRVERPCLDDLTRGVGDGELRERGAALQVVLVGGRPVRLQVSARGRADTAKQNHTALHPGPPHESSHEGGAHAPPAVAYVHE